MKFLFLAVWCVIGLCQLHASDELPPIAVSISGRDDDDATATALIYTVRDAFRNSKAFTLVSGDKPHVQISITELKITGGVAVMVVWTYHTTNGSGELYLNSLLLTDGPNASRDVTRATLAQTEKIWRQFTQ